MATLSDKVRDRLDKYLENLGDVKLGTELNNCFAQLQSMIGTTGKVKPPLFASTTAFEAACGKADGDFFYNTTTNTMFWCICGMWVQVDFKTINSTLASLSTKVGQNCTDIATLTTQLNNFITSFQTHDHTGGTEGPKLELKNSIIATGETAGHNVEIGPGGTIVCVPKSSAGIEVQYQGTTVDAAVTTLNFADVCLVATMTAAGEVSITIPSLKQALIDIDNVEAQQITNTTNISNNTTQIGTNTTKINTNCNDIDALELFNTNHDHTGGTNGSQLNLGESIVSSDGTTNYAANTLLCPDGAGGWTIVAKSSITGTAACGESLMAATGGVDIYTGVNAATDCLQFRGIVAGDCLSIATVGAGNEDIEISLDIPNLTPIGTAVDPAADLMIVYDASASQCVTTNVSNLLKVYNAGKALKSTVQPDGSCTFDLDIPSLGAITSAPDRCTDELLLVGDYPDGCGRVAIEKIDSNICVSSTTGLSVLDPVYFDDASGQWVKEDLVADKTKQATHVVVKIQSPSGNAVVQGYGFADLGTHGLAQGVFFWSDNNVAGGATTTASSTFGDVRNLLYEAVSATKIHIYAANAPEILGAGALDDRDCFHGAFADETAADTYLAGLTPVKKVGDAYFDSTDCAIKVWDGANYKEIALEVPKPVESMLSMTVTAANTFAVGDQIYNDGTSWVLADATDINKENAMTVVYASGTEFCIQGSGMVEVPGHGFTVGSYYFVDEANVGKPIATQPSIGNYEMGAFYVVDANHLQIISSHPSSLVQ